MPFILQMLPGGRLLFYTPPLPSSSGCGGAGWWVEISCVLVVHHHHRSKSIDQRAALYICARGIRWRFCDRLRPRLDTLNRIFLAAVRPASKGTENHFVDMLAEMTNPAAAESKNLESDKKCLVLRLLSSRG